MNRSDDKKIAQKFLDENNANFPTVLDSSNAANDLLAKYETLGGYCAVPLSYVIDKEGKVFTAYYGGRSDHESVLMEILGRGSVLKEPVEISDSMNCLEIQGDWKWEDGVLRQNDIEAIPSALTFTPEIKKGEIFLKARVTEGEEGIRVLFGFQKADQYFVWNLGADKNTNMNIERWYTLDGAIAFYEILNEPFELQVERNVWHSLRFCLDSTEGRVEGYIDARKVLDFKTGSQPITGRFGLSTWKTRVEFKDIQLEAR